MTYFVICLIHIFIQKPYGFFFSIVIAREINLKCVQIALPEEAFGSSG